MTLEIHIDWWTVAMVGAGTVVGLLLAHWGQFVGFLRGAVIVVAVFFLYASLRSGMHPIDVAAILFRIEPKSVAAECEPAAGPRKLATLKAEQ